MSVYKNIKNTLIDGLEQLIRDGSKKDYWFSSRAIADAVIALNFCLPRTEYLKLKHGALEHLIKAGEKSSNEGLNWMEEIWDTSIALTALSSYPEKFSNEIILASNWLDSKYLKSHNSWNDEVWETLLALNSLAYIQRSIPLDRSQQADYSGAINWLIQILDTPKPGMLINWSSTALYILLAQSAHKLNLNVEIIEKLNVTSKKSALALHNANILENENALWTAEAWSNGLVLWAYSLVQPIMFTEQEINKIYLWFQKRIADPDLPTEDRSFSCIGLFRFLEYLEYSEKYKALRNETFIQNTEADTLIREEIRESLQNQNAAILKSRIKDFQSKPPLFTNVDYPGYYTLNFRKKIIHISLIGILTSVLTYLTWQSQTVDDKTMRWLFIIPIVLGSLATIAQLANFNLLPKKK